MSADNLSHFEKDQLLAYFAHYMTMEQRTELIRQLPAAYNSWCDKEHARTYLQDDAGSYSRPVLK